MNITTHTKLHSWTRNFVDWIAPDSGTLEDNRKHAESVVESIQAKAEDGGLTVLEAKVSGSFEKGTGLRRHLLGDSSVEGQDIDLAFILKKEIDILGNLKCLIPDFRSFAESAYPDSEHPPLTKSSAPLRFKGKKLSYDLVPLYKSGNLDKQILIRTDGEERRTSVLKHIEFTHARVSKSNQEWGVVKFSDMVRLFKWWRYHQQETSGVFGNEQYDHKVPSFLLDILCAKAFDEHGVKSTYPETLAMWFACIEDIVHRRVPVVFDDYYKAWEEDSNAHWTVLDPVDKENNIVGNMAKWSNRAIDELAEWLADGRDRTNRSIRLTMQGKEVEAKAEMVALFGNAYNNHCEKD